MIGRCGQNWFLFFLVSTWGAEALAQDAWEISEGRAEPWEERWEAGRWSERGNFTLALTAGHRLRVGGIRSEGAFDSSEKRQENFYAYASLQFPFEGFLSGGRSPRAPSSPQAIALNSPPQEKKMERRAESTPPFDSTHSVDVDSPESEKSEEEVESRVSTREETRKKEETHFSPKKESADIFLALVAELVRVVKVSTGGAGTQVRLKSLVNRSRMSGLAPELRIRGVYGFDRTTSQESAVGIYPGDLTTRGGRDSLAEARLTFHLDRLVFGHQEAGLEKQRIQLQIMQDKRVDEALKLLLQWREAQTQIHDSTLLPEELRDALVSLESALARLHVLTKGWFRGEETVRAIERRVTASLEGEKRLHGRSTR